MTVQIAYSAPKVAPGDVVIYYPHVGSPAGFPARVNDVINDRLCNLVNLDDRSIRWGIAHAADPNLEISQEMSNRGCWDLTTAGKTVNDLQRTVADLQRRLSTLEARGDIEPAAVSKPRNVSNKSPWLNFSIPELKAIAEKHGIQPGKLWNRFKFAKEFEAAGVPLPEDN